MKELVEKLISINKTISTMESCTGGGLVNEITNIPGSSEVLKYSAVTYSNEGKIKMGVDPNVIEKYTVYSKEVSVEMAKNISKFTNSDYGVGITGQLKRVDENNPYGESDKVFFTIYDKENDITYTDSLIVTNEARNENKKQVINKIVDKLHEIIK